VQDRRQDPGGAATDRVRLQDVRRQSVVLVFLASGAFEIVLALVVVHGAVSVEADEAEESGHRRVHFSMPTGREWGLARVVAADSVADALLRIILATRGSFTC